MIKLIRVKARYFYRKILFQNMGTFKWMSKENNIPYPYRVEWRNVITMLLREHKSPPPYRYYVKHGDTIYRTLDENRLVR